MIRLLLHILGEIKKTILKLRYCERDVHKSRWPGLLFVWEKSPPQISEKREKREVFKSGNAISNYLKLNEVRSIADTAKARGTSDLSVQLVRKLFFEQGEVNLVYRREHNGEMKVSDDYSDLCFHDESCISLYRCTRQSTETYR